MKALFCFIYMYLQWEFTRIKPESIVNDVSEPFYLIRDSVLKDSLVIAGSQKKCHVKSKAKEVNSTTKVHIVVASLIIQENICSTIHIIYIFFGVFI